MFGFGKKSKKKPESSGVVRLYNPLTKRLSSTKNINFSEIQTARKEKDVKQFVNELFRKGIAGDVERSLFSKTKTKRESAKQILGYNKNFRNQVLYEIESRRTNRSQEILSLINQIKNTRKKPSKKAAKKRNEIGKKIRNLMINRIIQRRYETIPKIKQRPEYVTPQRTTHIPSTSRYSGVSPVYSSVPYESRNGEYMDVPGRNKGEYIEVRPYIQSPYLDVSIKEESPYFNVAPKS